MRRTQTRPILEQHAQKNIGQKMGVYLRKDMKWAAYVARIEEV